MANGATRASGPTAAPRSTPSRRSACASRVSLVAGLLALGAPGAAWADPGSPDAPASGEPVATGPAAPTAPVSGDLVGAASTIPASAATPAAAPASSDAPATQMPTGPDMPNEMTLPNSDFSLALAATGWTGHFGFPTRTTIGTLQADARYRIGNVRLSAAVPYTRIDSDIAVFTGIDGTPLIAAPVNPTGRRRREGLGDLTLGAAWQALSEDRAGGDLEFSGRVKLPTSSNDRLSTGRTDVAIGLEASKSFGRLVPLATVTYRWFGDTPMWRLRDGVALSVGSSFRLGQRVVLLATYDYADRTSDYIRDSQELVFGASAPIGPRLRISGYASAGLTSGAPAFSSGASIGFSFGRRG